MAIFSSSNAQHVSCPTTGIDGVGSENAPGGLKIGTKSRGLGPTYETKMGGRLSQWRICWTEAVEDAHRKCCDEKNQSSTALFTALGVDRKEYQEMPRRREIRPCLRYGGVAEPRDCQGRVVGVEGAKGSSVI